MKKQRVIVLDGEQQNKQDILAISEIQEGLNKMEQFPVYSPDLQWFEQMVLAEKKIIRKKLIRDLSIFFIVAIIILCGIMISLFQMPAVFIFLQIATTIFIAFYSGTRLLKKVKIG
ncbi:YxlC family protein [Paenibacillus sp. BSR1-1]|uniref:YxlC family protein n=1 Tax=Paenibacillus sp. BSR1-1 TaxID=3020845 RepID=UPI0025B03E25|nr:YxlC family protein [Paenibacillus sp. BSR1-1]MDN3015192.1 YxlC family protein [Paenibacillus sp. BSR1-1]